MKGKAKKSGKKAHRSQNTAPGVIKFIERVVAFQFSLYTSQQDLIRDWTAIKRQGRKLLKNLGVEEKIK